jgi:4-amino-4-deoxy-L-arabinose transferase-like glycosyltransferase
MAITIRDSVPRKRNIASLVGGYVIAVGCFVLWLLCASQLTQWPPSVPAIVAGLVVAVAVGVWIRLADL